MTWQQGRPSPRRIDLTGKRFGRLLVLKYQETREKRPFWKCRCDCKTVVFLDTKSLRTGHTKSCGCLRRDEVAEKNYRHGLAKNPFYGKWVDMMNRCYSPASKSYKDYGGRGIRVVKQWHDPRKFIEWCESQDPSPGMSLDRYPRLNGPYSPNNCRFATPKQQNRNMRSNVWVRHNGERLVFKDFVLKYGVVSPEIAQRRRKKLGWDAKIAATTPLIPREQRRKARS